MKKEPDDQEARPEYDFSGGVRGKYASRFGDAREDLLRSAAIMDRQVWLAHSLQALQALESSLVAYWALVFETDPRSAGRRVSGLLEALDKKALGTLWKDLRKHTSATDSFHEELVELLGERNWLVHKSFHETDPDRDVSMGLERFESIVRRSEDLDDQLTTYLIQRCSDRGMDPSEVRARSEEVVHRWARERDAA